MAIADYFQRGALAAAQAVNGFNEATFRDAIETTTVGIAVGPEAAETREGRLVADLTTRLVARFYPRLSIHTSPKAEDLADSMAALARRINPSIEILDSRGLIGIEIGTDENVFECSIVAGADGWMATIGQEPQPLGDSNNPFGAGAAACLACANLFRFVFTGGTDQLDRQTCYSTYHGDTISNAGNQPAVGGTIPQSSVLVGAGAIGNAGPSVDSIPLITTDGDPYFGVCNQGFRDGRISNTMSQTGIPPPHRPPDSTWTARSSGFGPNRRAMQHFSPRRAGQFKACGIHRSSCACMCSLVCSSQFWAGRSFIHWCLY